MTPSKIEPPTFRLVAQCSPWIMFNRRMFLEVVYIHATCLRCLRCRLQTARQFPILQGNVVDHQSVLHSVHQVQTVTYYYARKKPKTVIFNYGKRNYRNIHSVFLRFLGLFWVRPCNYFSKLFIAFLGVTQFKDTLRTNLHLKLSLQ